MVAYGERFAALNCPLPGALNSNTSEPNARMT